jgi:hypothetical protein
MAPKTVTRGVKPKRKIVISTIEINSLLYILYIYNIIIQYFYVHTIINKNIQLLKLNRSVLSYQYDLLK